MFTGLVECCGEVVEFQSTAGGRKLRVSAAGISNELGLGESVAVNGCCLTAAMFDHDTVEFDLLDETLKRTNLGDLDRGRRVNLERAMRADARLGGHFVQGHVDETAKVVKLESEGSDVGITLEIPAGHAQYFIRKGSIAVNGVSLTVADLNNDTFRVWIIPHTLELTNLGDLVVGDRVNLEVDMLAKYVERMLAGSVLPSRTPEA